MTVETHYEEAKGEDGVKFEKSQNTKHYIEDSLLGNDNPWQKLYVRNIHEFVQKYKKEKIMGIDTVFLQELEKKPLKGYVPFSDTSDHCDNSTDAEGLSEYDKDQQFGQDILPF